MEYILLVFSTLSIILMNGARALQVDTMDTWKSSISLRTPDYGYSSSGILKSHSGSRYTLGRNKTLLVSAPEGYRILVSIRFIDLRPYNQDLLTLYTVNDRARDVTYSNSASYKKKDYYPREDVIYDIPSGKLGIVFYTSPGIANYGYEGFELVYTVQANGYQCRYDNFYCRNGKCIAKVLRCDGHNHCGDRSSENNCVVPVSYGGKIGMAFGGIFVVIAIACGIFVVCKRARGSVTETQVITSHPPPPTNLPSYPPVYPQPGTYYPQPPPPYSQGVTNPGYH